MAKRGRPRGKKLGTNIAFNYSFWRTVLSNKEETEMFLKRSSKCRLLEMGNVLRYIKRTDIDFFDSINGQTILSKIFK